MITDRRGWVQRLVGAQRKGTSLVRGWLGRGQGRMSVSSPGRKDGKGNVLGRGNSICKGLEAEESLSLWRTRRKDKVAGGGCARGEGVEAGRQEPYQAGLWTS